MEANRYDCKKVFSLACIGLTAKCCRGKLFALIRSYNPAKFKHFSSSSLLKGRPQTTSAQNREKLTPPLVRKISALVQPPSPLVCADTINFEKPEVFCTKKCGRPHLTNPLFPCPHWTNPLSPLTADVFYGQSLIVLVNYLHYAYK